LMIKPGFPPRFFPEIMIAIVLSLLVAGSYWPVGDHDFINYDDILYVTHNAHVKITAFFQAALLLHPDDPGLKAALLQTGERRDAPQKVLD
jgi:hypothetical protein